IDPRDILLAQPEQEPGAAPRDNRLMSELPLFTLTQAALVTIEIALARLWMAAGIRPAACLGYSTGEYVAACVAGVLSLEDMVSMIALRGRLMEQTPPGTMLAVMASEATVRESLIEDAWVAASNSPTQCVLSGTVPAIAAMEASLTARQIETRRFPISGGFHSGLMATVFEPLARAARGVKLGAVQIPYVSNLTGNWVTANDLADECYWSRSAREAVRFSEGIERLLEFGANVFVEVGPGRTLTAYTRQHLNTSRPEVVTAPTMVSIDTTLSEPERFFDAFSRVWIAGVEPDWRQYYASEKRQSVRLPVYPFASKRYWLERRTTESALRALPVKTDNPAGWLYQPVWNQVVLDESTTDGRTIRWLFVGDADDIANAAASELERRGADVTVVPSADRHAVMKSLASDGVPLRVVHAWAPGPDAFPRLLQLVFPLCD